ncbi:hypothetical protein BDR04DRAFT_795045 [Suillus decipiens]|nr:hypothetical protein BDR04DRAFT_795045 [Suillus decipiens]
MEWTRRTPCRSLTYDFLSADACSILPSAQHIRSYVNEQSGSCHCHALFILSSCLPGVRLNGYKTRTPTLLVPC